MYEGGDMFWCSIVGRHSTVLTSLLGYPYRVMTDSAVSEVCGGTGFIGWRWWFASGFVGEFGWALRMQMDVDPDVASALS